MKCILTIAGSDCSGGAGIQADLKTIAAHKMYGMSAITALTAQNTTGVSAVQEASPDILAAELDCIFTDIFPDAVKIGMVSSAALIRVIAAKLRQYHPHRIVVDPVMISTSGSRLLRTDAEKALQTQLLPLADLITPNLDEAAALTGAERPQSRGAMARLAAELCRQTGSAVLVKGGHLRSGMPAETDIAVQPHGTAAVRPDHPGTIRPEGAETAPNDDAVDCLCLPADAAAAAQDGSRPDCTWFTAPRVDNPNTHGTGCTLSSAIACELAAGRSLAGAVAEAKKYLTGALRAGLNLGRGSGPLDHLYCL
ncbi:MAG: bifunctional hydroxymethylpyrimidine kinase/phosphomethylpyrimidine kinase [Anaerovoracaceae bacterium]|jgi:hydroxymethylpyrimidine/phosphomethylpyrimidine kinase